MFKGDTDHYHIMYTKEKLKSLEATIKFRKTSLEDMVEGLNKIKETLKLSSLNTLKNHSMLQNICEIQNNLRTELGFNRAFLDEILRQQQTQL